MIGLAIPTHHLSPGEEGVIQMEPARELPASIYHPPYILVSPHIIMLLYFHLEF